MKPPTPGESRGERNHTMSYWKPNYGEQTRQLKAVGLSVQDLRNAGFIWGRSQSWEGPETEEARQIVARLNGEIMAEFKDEAVAAKTSQPLPSATVRPFANGRVEKATALLKRMTAEADKKESPRQENTPKRAAIAGRFRQEAARLHRAAAFLHSYTLHPEKMPSTWTPNKDDAMEAARQKMSDAYGYYGVSRENGEPYPTTNANAIALRQAYGNDPMRWREETPEEKAKKTAKIMEEEIRFSPIPGFFPTPSAIITKMIDALSLTSYETTLEPSAGKGDIADALLAHCVRPDVCEVNHKLREILTTKGHKIVCDDFLQYFPAEQYQKIIMNPPFERGQDRQHIRHAFDQCLASGGRLVALCSASSPGNEEFSKWISEHSADVEELPPGSFSGSDSFRQTGVNVCMITIDKDKN